MLKPLIGHTSTKLVPLLVAVGAATLAIANQEPGSAGSEINLSNYRLTFADEFNDLSVSSFGSHTRWIAHTPWHGDFGDAQFTDPGPDFPFTVKDGILSITMKKDSTGKWRSGLLSSSDGKGSSFVQEGGGYFEMRAKLPEGPGVWPAFWLGSSTGGGRGKPEIDIMEYHGHDNTGFMINVHLWGPEKEVYHDYKQVEIPPASFTNEFNTVGVDIGKEWTTFYVNRREVWKVVTQPEYLNPVYILANLAAGSGWPIVDMKDPSVMQIDYIRAFKRK